MKPFLVGLFILATVTGAQQNSDSLMLAEISDRLHTIQAQDKKRDYVLRTSTGFWFIGATLSGLGFVADSPLLYLIGAGFTTGGVVSYITWWDARDLDPEIFSGEGRRKKTD